MSNSSIDEPTNARRPMLKAAVSAGLATLVERSGLLSRGNCGYAWLSAGQRHTQNRLYMASCHSLYAVYVESHGAV